MQTASCSALLLLTIACGSGGQSGTDQFDVGRVRPMDAADAGASRGSDERDPETAADDSIDESPVPTPPEPLPPPAATGPARLPEIQPLCDGSDAIRFSAALGSSVGGGPVAFYNAFLPGKYLVIDGKCRYWVNDWSLAGLRSGVLGAEEAEAYADSLHYGQYEVISEYESAQCPDGGGMTLTDSTGSIVCRCGACSGGGEPAEFREAFAAALELADDVGARQEWAWGPSSFLAVATGEEAELSWTLDVDLAPVAYDTAEQSFSNDAGVLVEGVDQLTLLSALRQASINDGQSSQLFVTQDGNRYALYVRDEPPAEVLDALTVDAHR
jgi:hypothetical protein